jgi:hypothetical protein
MNEIYVTIAAASADSGSSWEPENLYVGHDLVKAQKAALAHIAREPHTDYDEYSIQTWRDGELFSDLIYLQQCEECAGYIGPEVVNFNDGRTVCWVCLLGGHGLPVDSPAVDEAEALRLMAAIQERFDEVAPLPNPEFWVAHQTWQEPIKYAADVIQGLIVAQSKRGDNRKLRTWVEEQRYQYGETIASLVECWDSRAEDE